MVKLLLKVILINVADSGPNNFKLKMVDAKYFFRIPKLGYFISGWKNVFKTIMTGAYYKKGVQIKENKIVAEWEIPTLEPTPTEEVTPTPEILPTLEPTPTPELTTPTLETTPEPTIIKMNETQSSEEF